SVGGIDIEELSIEQPDKISYTHVDPIRGLTGYKAIEIWSDLGLEGNILRQASTILSKLFNAFMQYDANILEINPLVITATDEVLVAASVMGVDENALFRQPELKDMVQVGSDRTWRPMTELEKHMVTVNEQEAYRGTARYTEMDGGDIGVMCGGGGASLLLMDALIKAGGRPANYSEVGGNPPENKVFGLCKGILSKKGVRGFFLGHNITSNTQIDVVASGVVRAFQDLKIDPKTFPVVVREAGTHDTEGKLIFEKYGIEYNGDDITLTQAAQKMVAKMRQVYPDYDQWGDK
ncbi:MAG TPA: ATP-grasp domain-containing protein, partial [Candidatus Limnocylindrales bacterium]|nr:ATP-grasp domain-containing protein [Candidatus Limnocylindrales bacterium]